MNDERELSVVGWLLLIGIFAGLGYWFLQPLQPLTSVWPCVQTVLKGIVFGVTVAWQVSMMANNDLDNEVSITYFILLTLLQICAIISLVFSTNFLNASSENNFIGFLYTLVVGTFAIIYGMIIAMTILWMITAGAETIDYFIRRRAKYVLPKLPIVKLLFKQPKQFKPNKKVKM